MIKVSLIEILYFQLFFSLETYIDEGSKQIFAIVPKFFAIFANKLTAKKCHQLI